VFLSNSGAEAVEGALKLARYATKRPYAISFHGALHGRTMGALTDSKAKYHKGFGPLVPANLHAPYADPRRTAAGDRDTASIDYLRNSLFRYEVEPTEVAAIFAEPIQGRTRSNRVWAGRARCGPSSTPRPSPTSSPVQREWPPVFRSVRSSRAKRSYLATLEVLRSENLLDNSTNLGAVLLAGLRKIQANEPRIVRDVHGVGLFIGVEFPDGRVANDVQNRCFERACWFSRPVRTSSG
jgi:4-aminobutyrate aminotransferase